MKISKNIKPFFFFSLLFLPAFFFCQNKSANIQSIDGKKFYIHTIEKSQSLYAISKLYGVTLEELYAVNPELRAGAKVHQEIKVPFAPSALNVSATNTTSTIDTNKYLTYRISKSETVYSLSKKFNLSEKQLNVYNPSLAQGLKEGQVIVVGEKQKKKIPVRELRDNKPQVTYTPGKMPVLMDSSLLRPPSKPKKPKYNIALILPFKLDHTNNLDLGEMLKNNVSFPVVPALAIDFYLGFKKAVDSLVSKDFEINLELYDVDDRDSLKLIQIVADPKFRETDLIFGPLYASGFKTISKKAKELHIPIVSPITQQNKILYNNIYISKTNPSQFTLLESLADYCIDSLVINNANIILMSASGDKKEISFVSAFKKYYNEKQKNLGKQIKDTITLAKGINGLKSSYRPNVKNVIISLSNSQVFIADFTTQLAMFADKKDIVLCGWQNVSEMDNIDQEYLNQLNYTFPHQFNVSGVNNYSVIANSYKTQQETMPGKDYFMGFDIALYYLKNLRDSGPDFVHSLDNLPAETNYMKFKFTRPDMATGFDNRGVYIFKYNNYQLLKTGWQ